MQPRPESRIESLEKRASTIEAAILELSSDTAEELKAIRQDIKHFDEGMMSSFKKIGDTIIDTLATKDDISAVEARLDRIETIMATKEDIGRIEAVQTEQGKKLDLLLELVQKKLGE